MRKRNSGRILSRPKNQRKALLKSLATSLFMHGKIKTTESKAKELRSSAEKLITISKLGGVSKRRIAAALLSEKVVKKLFAEIGPKYQERKGGYTRITRIGPRLSDGAKMVIIELV